MRFLSVMTALTASLIACATSVVAADTDAAFFEKHIRPILVTHCYECHSEQAGEQQGGLLLDRSSGWLKGGNTQKAVVPGEVDASLLLDAISYENEDLQMPPDGKLDESAIGLLIEWVRRGAPGPADDLSESEFSRLGDQGWLFEQAAHHWAFQPVADVDPPQSEDAFWNRHAVAQFVFARLTANDMSPSPSADP